MMRLTTSPIVLYVNKRSRDSSLHRGKSQPTGKFEGISAWIHGKAQGLTRASAPRARSTGACGAVLLAAPYTAGSHQTSDRSGRYHKLEGSGDTNQTNAKGVEQLRDRDRAPNHIFVDEFSHA